MIRDLNIKFLILFMIFTNLTYLTLSIFDFFVLTTIKIPLTITKENQFYTIFRLLFINVTMFISLLFAEKSTEFFLNIRGLKKSIIFILLEAVMILLTFIVLYFINLIPGVSVSVLVVFIS